jgi:hypothetical protein
MYWSIGTADLLDQNETEEISKLCTGEKGKNLFQDLLCKNTRK